MTLNPLNHKRLSSTSRMFLGQIKAFRTRSQRQPPQIACLPEGRPPKDFGLPSPDPDWVIAQALLRVLSATTSNPLCRFFGARLRTVRSELGPSEQVVAVAPCNTLPEFLATAAKTSILLKFIRDRLDLSGTEEISLAAGAA